MLYLPFRFLAVNALLARFRGVFKFFLATIAGISLSSGVEIAQLHDVGRVPSMGDVYANGTGVAYGAATGILLGATMRWLFVGELAANPIGALLFTMFFAYRLPYVPVIDLHRYWHAVRPMTTS